MTRALHFMNIYNPPCSLIDQDGIVVNYGVVLDASTADAYYNTLLEQIQWKHDTVKIMGKEITTKRAVAWYGQKPYQYKYSGITKTASLFTTELLEIKNVVEQYTGVAYNACLLNLYHDGNEGMSWHSDDERELAPSSSIASLSLGASRKFAFRHKILGHKIAILLEHGMLIEMKGTLQKFWQHALPISKKVLSPRINLTFRQLG